MQGKDPQAQPQHMQSFHSEGATARLAPSHPTLTDVCIPHGHVHVHIHVLLTCSPTSTTVCILGKVVRGELKLIAFHIYMYLPTISWLYNNYSYVSTPSLALAAYHVMPLLSRSRIAHRPGDVFLLFPTGVNIQFDSGSPSFARNT